MQFVSPVYLYAGVRRPGILTWATAHSFALMDHIGSAITIITVLYGISASVFLWRASFRRHRYSKVYFPRNREDFYRYYALCIRRSRERVFITSDGFNMRNSDSHHAAALMRDAQLAAMARGVSIVRYQMLETMHINWIDEICRIKASFPDLYKVFFNREYEAVGHFALIDPDTRHSIVEFMLPSLGDFGQATSPRDYGFIHGHIEKADRTQSAFKEILAHPDTVEISSGNAEGLKRALWGERIARHNTNRSYRLFDEEIITAIMETGERAPKYSDVFFKNLSTRNESMTLAHEKTTSLVTLGEGSNGNLS